MAMVYASLIKKGLKKIGDVPEVLREQVRDILNESDAGAPQD